jgi:hypothetical protein
MRIPQPPERIKEAPAQALRAVFAGVGQVLLMTERAARRTTAAPAAAVPEPAAAAVPEPAAAAVPAAEAAVPAPGPAAAAVPEAVIPAAAEADLPVPNYSELSVASLRARLRGLDAGQVRRLLGYERSRAARADVIAMFERRIAKLEGSEDADSTAG